MVQALELTNEEALREYGTLFVFVGTPPAPPPQGAVTKLKTNAKEINPEVKMSDQQPQHTKEELAKLIQKQRKQQEIIDQINAKFSRPRKVTRPIFRTLAMGLFEAWRRARD